MLTSPTANWAFHTIQLTQDDVAVISVPSYGGRVPATAVERLATLNGQGAVQCWFVFMETVPMKTHW